MLIIQRLMRVTVIESQHWLLVRLGSRSINTALTIQWQSQYSLRSTRGDLNRIQDDSGHQVDSIDSSMAPRLPKT